MKILRLYRKSFQKLLQISKKLLNLDLFENQSAERNFAMISAMNKQQKEQKPNKITFLYSFHPFFCIFSIQKIGKVGMRQIGSFSGVGKIFDYLCNRVVFLLFFCPNLS